MTRRVLGLPCAGLIGLASAMLPATAQDKAPPDLVALIKEKLRAKKR